MSLAKGRVDPDYLQIGLLEGIKNSLEVAFFAPVSESLINMVPVAKIIRQVAPRRAGRADPNDRVEEQPNVAARSALASRNMWLNKGPFFI